MSRVASPPATSRPSRRELACAAAVYGALTVPWLWPLPLHLATHSVHGLPVSGSQGEDFHLIVWALAWGAHALVTAPLHLFDANAFHPAPLSLAFSEHFLGLQPLFAPFYWLTGNGVLAANLLIVAMQVLCATAMYALARRFVDPPGAFCAGFLYAVAPWRRLSLDQFHLLGVQYLPLALLFGERWLDAARRRDAVLLAAVLTVQMLSSVYLAYAAMLLLAAYVPLALVHWRRRLDRRRLVGLALALLVPCLAFGLTCLPYLRLQGLGLIPSYREGTELPPLGVWAAPRMMRTYLAQGGVGTVGYALGALALLPPWRRRGWPSAIALAAVVVGVAVGHGTSAYHWLAAWVPGFDALRAPVRFSLVAHLGFALLAGLGLARLAALMPAALRGPVVVAALTAAVWTWSAVPPLRLIEHPVGATVPPAYRWLAAHGEGRALLELPGGTPTIEARRMYLSTYHWLPIVGGYSAYPPATARYVHGIASGLPATAALQGLVNTIDVGWILVHLDEFPAAAAWSDTMPDGLTTAMVWPDALLLRVTRPGDPHQRARLLSERETLGAVPLAPLGTACPGRIELLGEPPARVAPGASVRLMVAIHNTGSAPWPGLAFVTRHLVQAMACLQAASSPSCPTQTIPLRADVAPGYPHVVQADVPVSRSASGPHRLRVELVQRGDGPLSRCGVAPLVVPLEVAKPAPTT